MRALVLALTLVLGNTAFSAENYSAAAAKHYKGIALTDQDGGRVQLYDLMKGRTVVMHTFYTGCKSTCSIQMKNLQTLQKELGTKMGKEVRFISVTVDPERDTPAVLRKHADLLGAGPAWSFLTGTKEEVDRALKAFGQWSEFPESHPTILLVGKEKTGVWKQIYSIGPSKDIKATVDSVLTAKTLKQPAKSGRR
jgi:protein SCO1/2